MISNKNLIKILSELYDFDYNEAILLMDIDDNTDNSTEVTVQDTINKNKKDENKTLSGKDNRDSGAINKNIKPFDGIVREDCCKAVVFNHGLYTQCLNKTKSEYCSNNCKKQKYGSINDRKNYGVGRYVLSNGRKEIDYKKLLRRLERKIVKKESEDEEEYKEEEIIKEKKARGRPKMEEKEICVKIDTMEEEDRNIDEKEILVKRTKINNKEYLISNENIVYDIKNYRIIGKLLLGKIISL